MEEGLPHEAPPAVEPTVGGDAVVQNASRIVDFERLFTFLEDIIDSLSFSRVALVGLLSFVGLIMFSVYENRNQIVEKIVQPTHAEEPIVTSWVLSDESKAALKKLADDTAVAFISVTDVDLKKNRRSVRYYYVEPGLFSTTANITLAQPRPVFDYDAKNTAQMVAVLGNEFRCDNFKDTAYAVYNVALAEKMPTICRLAIPPFVGQFVGFLSVGMSKQMTKQELDSIRLEVSRLAVEIYLNDVVKKPAK